jgi:hypothetical protein
MFKIHYLIATGKYSTLYFALIAHGHNHYSYSILDRQFKILDSGYLTGKEEIIPKMKSAIKPFGEFKSLESLMERNVKSAIGKVLNASVS